MIWYWLVVGIRRVVWFFRIPDAQEIAKIDPNRWCPVCGAKNGRIRCVIQAEAMAPAKNIPPKTKVLCQHTCNECGARCFEEPVAKEADQSTILPSVARTELEKAEDRAAYLQTQKVQAN